MYTPSCRASNNSHDWAGSRLRWKQRRGGPPSRDEGGAVCARAASRCELSAVHESSICQQCPGRQQVVVRFVGAGLSEAYGVGGSKIISKGVESKDRNQGQGRRAMV